MKLILLLITVSLYNTASAQKIQPYEDHYESGKLYCNGYQVKVNGTCCEDVGLWTYWYENGNKISEEMRFINAPG